MEVRCGRIQAKLHSQLVSALEPRAQVLLDVDLYRPLAQAIEQLAAQLTGPGPK